MKTIKYLFIVVAALAAASCTEEVVEKGQPDVDGCYGVYFPEEQENSGSIDLDPVDPTDLSFTVARTVETGDITVPVTVKASEEGIFTVDPITFEDGQTETTFSVHFPNAEIGKSYDCEILLEDPQYVSSYTLNPVSVSFSLSRVKWNRVYGKLVNGKWEKATAEDPDKVEYGAWRDDIMSSMFGFSSLYAINDKLEIYERDDQPGYYRIQDVYNPYMLAQFWGNAYPESEFEGNCTAGTYSYIDARDPENIGLPYQSTGATVGSDGYIEFETPQNADGSYSEPGTLVNGVFNFPAKGIYVYFTVSGGPYSGNASSKTTILLPGAVFTDYSLSLKAGKCTDGTVPVYFTLGSDVAKVAYEVYEGKLDDGEIYENTLTLQSSTDAKTVDLTKKAVAVSGLKTGVYTIIAVGFSQNGNKYEVQKSASASFSYIAKGDSVPVVVAAGVGSAEKYTPAGVNTDNSIEVYVYGSDLTAVKMAAVQKSSVLADSASVAASLIKSTSVSDEILKEINGTGYIDVATGLLPGTEYVLMVYATNGYEEKVIVSETSQYTTGKPLPIYQSFSASDMSDEIAPATSAGFFGKYNFYAVDYFGRTGLREYISKATISDSEEPDSEVDEYGYKDEYVNISGLFDALKSGNSGDPNYDGTMVWDCYAGYLYSLSQPLGQWNGYYLLPFITEESYGLFSSDYDALIIGGFVMDGYIAFVGSPSYLKRYGYNFNGIAAYAYKDANYTSGAGTVARYSDLLLVAEDKDDNGVAPATSAASVATAELHKISDAISSLKLNCVQPEKIQIRQAIDKARASARLYSDFAGIEGKREVKVADCKTVSVDAQPMESAPLTLKAVLR
jgi:hypothetical protein